MLIKKGDKYYKVIRKNGKFAAWLSASRDDSGKIRDIPKDREKFQIHRARNVRRWQAKRKSSISEHQAERFKVDEFRSKNFTENSYSRPIEKKRGKLEVFFLFIKIKPYHEQKVGAMSRGIREISERNYPEMFRECYQKALAQIDFSPDRVKIISIRYIYYER